MSAEERRDGRSGVSRVVRELLRGIVDYAGLFPPAALPMRTAVDNFASYRRGADAWALGRFVVPAARLEELASTIAPLDESIDNRGWRVSALIGADLTGDLTLVRAFNVGAEAARRDIAVDALELKAAGEEEIRSALEAVPSALTSYVEIPLQGDPGDLIRAIRGAGGRAKVRTGGVTADMFPRPDALLRFLQACVEVDVPFKATAGLHHPVGGRYPLTYEAQSAVATMYGYFNLLFATVLTGRGAPDSLVVAALRESDPAAFRLHAEGVGWREHVLRPEEVPALRERSFVAFGSCSFREPMDELPFGAATDAGSTDRALAP